MDQMCGSSSPYFCSEMERGCSFTGSKKESNELTRASLSHCVRSVMFGPSQKCNIWFCEHFVKSEAGCGKCSFFSKIPLYHILDCNNYEDDVQCISTMWTQIVTSHWNCNEHVKHYIISVLCILWNASSCSTVSACPKKPSCVPKWGHTPHDPTQRNNRDIGLCFTDCN